VDSRSKARYFLLGGCSVKCVCKVLNSLRREQWRCLTSIGAVAVERSVTRVVVSSF